MQLILILILFLTICMCVMEWIRTDGMQVLRVLFLTTCRKARAEKTIIKFSTNLFTAGFALLRKPLLFSTSTNQRRIRTTYPSFISPLPARVVRLIQGSRLK